MSEPENPWESPKIIEKVSRWGSGVKARHGRVTYNIQFFLCLSIYAVRVGVYRVFFSVRASCVVV